MDHVAPGAPTGELLPSLTAEDGQPERLLYERLGLHPVRMLALPRPRVESILHRSGLDVGAVDERGDPVWRFSSTVYYASRA